MHRDPVCGRKMNPNKAHAKLMHEGVLYLLCCPRCQSEFASDPAKYAVGGSRSANRKHDHPLSKQG